MWLNEGIVVILQAPEAKPKFLLFIFNNHERGNLFQQVVYETPLSVQFSKSLNLPCKSIKIKKKFLNK